MDRGGLESPAKSMDWDAVFSRIRTPCPPAAQSTDFDEGFRKSGVSSTGSVDSMSDEAISERASVWGNGVASMVLKNSSRVSTPRCSRGSLRLTESAALSCSEETVTPKVPKSVEHVLSSFQLASMVCDAGAIDQQEGLPSILYASAGFMRMTGYCLEEIVGKDCMFMRGAGTDAREIGRVRTALKKCDVYIGKLLSYKKDGTPFWNLCTLSPISDDRGKVIKYIGIQAELNDYRKKRTKSRKSVDIQPPRPDRSESIPMSIRRSISEITSMITSRSNRPRLGDEDNLPVFEIPALQKAVEMDSRDRSATRTLFSQESGTNSACTIDSRLTVPVRDGNSCALTIWRSKSVDSQLEASRRKSKGYSLTIQRNPSIESSGDPATIPPRERSSSIVERRSLVKPEERPDADDIRPSGSQPLLWFLAAERSAEVDELKAKRNSVDAREATARGKSDGHAEDKTDRRASSVTRLFRSLKQLDRKSCNELQEPATPSKRFHVRTTDSDLHETPCSDLSSRKLDGRDRVRHYSMRYFSSSRSPSLDLLKAAKSTPSRHSVSDLRTPVPLPGSSNYNERAPSGGPVLDRSQFCVVHE